MKSRIAHDRALLLYGCKRNEVLNLAEIEQYGLDSFADANYVSIYGMPPREWYPRGVRLLGRTAVECTRDALGDHIGRDVASAAVRMPANQFVVIDLVHGDYRTLLEEHLVQEDRGIVAFIAPPWGTALDEVHGLDLRRTTPPIIEVIDNFSRRFPAHKCSSRCRPMSRLACLH